MKTPTTLQNTATTAAEFRLPNRSELGYICVAALMPYVLACLLLAF
jgi:hypothetical protein